MQYGILIANWNGADTIERCVGSVLAGVRRLDQAASVIVVDDASSDDSARTIAESFPSVELLKLSVNVGFAQAVNKAMQELDTPWVFLLNNDLALPADYFERLLAAKDSLGDENLFAIGAQTVQWGTNQPNHAGMLAEWNGTMIVQRAFEATGLAPTDFVQAGACLISREKFFALGGFPALYHPGYWEDYDLAYRARRMGWRNYYEPRAVAFHYGQRSMSALMDDEGLALLVKRNHLLFNWVNLSDRKLLFAHLRNLGGLVRGTSGEADQAGASWGRALFSAMRRLPEVLRVRRGRAGTTAVSDRQILMPGG